MGTNGMSENEDPLGQLTEVIILANQHGYEEAANWIGARLRERHDQRRTGRPVGDECMLDHDGNCQAHNWFGEGECPHARVARHRALVELLVARHKQHGVSDQSMSAATMLAEAGAALARVRITPRHDDGCPGPYSAFAICTCGSAEALDLLRSLRRKAAV